MGVDAAKDRNERGRDRNRDETTIEKGAASGRNKGRNTETRRSAVENTNEYRNVRRWRANASSASCSKASSSGIGKPCRTGAVQEAAAQASTVRANIATRTRAGTDACTPHAN